MLNRNRLRTMLLLIATFSPAADKPKLTLDEFFDSVDISDLQLSPDGHSLVFKTERADWNQNIYRDDLWLYRDNANGSLTQLTQSGHDSAPQWSPDGRWIAFLSERKNGNDSGDDSGDGTAQLYLISPSGGEAFPVTAGDESIHAFAWSADAHSLYFATRIPWTHEQKDAYKKEWKDVIQYRAAERGDMIFSVDLAGALARHADRGTSKDKADDATGVNLGARALASSPWRIQTLKASPDGRRLALLTESISEREERVEEFEIYTVDLANASPNRPPHQVTQNQGVEQSMRWAKDSQHIFFQVEYGSVEGKYHDTQTRLYWADADSGEIKRWAADFEGAVGAYADSPDGGVVAAGRLGTEVQLYAQANPSAPFSKLAGWPGTYERITTAAHSPRIAFIHSSLDKPNEVYMAENVAAIASARPITSFNRLFTERDLPKGKPYRWVADDGTTVEGMLIYPPGKFEARSLPMFVLIHGGPDDVDDTDGNHFEADWYRWERMAATQGWLVFQPNYRGSCGYGDKFLEQMVPQIVSRPGKDILEGVDALVKDGIADPAHLAVGGYSYGGYMTNWLITQTTRFKAAVTGAGAVENVANWGNDDTSFDDAFDLGGLPWEVPQRYQDEAAIFQMDKVRTPTLIVAGADDIRVAVAEAYLLDHALHNLGVPSSLLIFPGEGHSLEKDPWHGKIKVREELKWLQKYGGVPVSPGH
jgi:dipeptidyl aminopeptidase/acylaminoacyl peptidase